MIPTKTDIEVQGSLPGEDVQMTLDANSLEHLMSVLTNLYSDKTLAIVREYSTNALDSHIEAGVTRPIEISTPSDFKPFFTVRDYGVGMDAETIRNVYSRYGASTKRGTNSQNGMLGLGSKSALTYTTQFKVTGVKGGVKTHVLVSRSVDGSGVMKIISQSETNEPNGVTIEIPVTNRREIENAAYKFFRFWKPGTVLLNGKDPAVVKGIRLGDFLVTSGVDGIEGDRIVMGNVAYPIPESERIYKNRYARAGVVAYVDMGEVNFTPSRESLHMTTLTKDTLAKLRTKLTVEVEKYIEDQISNAADHTEALKNYTDIKDGSLGIYANGIKYKGETIPTHVEFKWLYHINAGTMMGARSVEIKRMLMNKCVIVHGYEHDKVHTAHRQKMRLWLDINNATDTAFVYICKEVPQPHWLKSITSVHWDDVRALKLNRPKSDSIKNDLFDMIDRLGRRSPNHKVDPKKPIVFASPTDFAAEEKRDLVARFITNQNDTQLVLVNKNKWKSFKKEFPAAQYIDDYVVKTLDDYLANLTPEEKLYLKSNWQDRSFCARLDASKILDPVLKAAVKSLSTAGLSDKTHTKYELMQAVAHRWQYTNFPRLTSNWSDRLFEQYPLLDVYGHRDLKYLPSEHIYLYLNNCYKENLVKY